MPPINLEFAVEGQAIEVTRRMPKKSKRYAEAFKLKLRNNNSNANVVFSSRGFVVSLRDETIFICDSSHSAIKDAYFCFGLCGYNINTFLTHVASLPSGVIQSAGDLSPENTEISHFQPAPL